MRARLAVIACPLFVGMRCISNRTRWCKAGRNTLHWFCFPCLLVCGASRTTQGGITLGATLCVDCVDLVCWRVVHLESHKVAQGWKQHLAQKLDATVGTIPHGAPWGGSRATPLLPQRFCNVFHCRAEKCRIHVMFFMSFVFCEENPHPLTFSETNETYEKHNVISTFFRDI